MQTINIQGQIKGIKYQPFLCDKLKIVDIKDFDINEVSATCILKTQKNTFSISKWVSPKRTRSYPFARVYNSLTSTKKITVIPIIKDEGIDGDRDFIQWDTVSLMSLLDVFVIFAFYETWELNPRYKNKITNQKFNNNYVLSKIAEIENYHSSSLHWNLNELQHNLQPIIQKAKNAYAKIEQSSSIKFHDVSGIDNFNHKIGNSVSAFISYSRNKAKCAQKREVQTKQPKEHLSSETKSLVTITNYLGGVYFLTADEVEIKDDTVMLIESKDTSTSLLPSNGDIKDGLLTMILFSNLECVTVNNKPMKSQAVLQISSQNLKGKILSTDTAIKQNCFFKENRFTKKTSDLIKLLFDEAKQNNFFVRITER